MDQKLKQFRFVAPGALLLWIAWCFFVVYKVAPMCAALQANNHIFAIAMTLVLLPLAAGTAGMIVWLNLEPS